MSSALLRIGALTTLTGIALALIMWHDRVIPALYYSSRAYTQPTPVNTLGLSTYRATIEARRLAGLDQNVSGLTFNPERGTLFTVINRPAQIAELTTEGVVLRVLPLIGASDPEGITHVQGDLYVIADEGDDRLYWVHIPDGQSDIRIDRQKQLNLKLAKRKNRGLEGVSWDGRTQRLLLAQEKHPIRIMSIEGQTALNASSALPADVVEASFSRRSGPKIGDLSSLTLHEPSGNLLMLSDESAVILEYSADGTWLGILPLWRWTSGLRNSIPQAEGLAVGNDGAIYVISEPNLFYRFERTP